MVEGIWESDRHQEQKCDKHVLPPLIITCNHDSIRISSDFDFNSSLWLVFILFSFFIYLFFCFFHKNVFLVWLESVLCWAQIAFKLEVILFWLHSTVKLCSSSITSCRHRHRFFSSSQKTNIILNTHRNTLQVREGNLK